MDVHTITPLPLSTDVPVVAPSNFWDWLCFLTGHAEKAAGQCTLPLQPVSLGKDWVPLDSVIPCSQDLQLPNIWWSRVGKGGKIEDGIKTKPSGTIRWTPSDTKPRDSSWCELIYGSRKQAKKIYYNCLPNVCFRNVPMFTPGNFIPQAAVSSV